jgi:hypothetical protein
VAVRSEAQALIAWTLRLGSNPAKGIDVYRHKFESLVKEITKLPTACVETFLGLSRKVMHIISSVLKNSGASLMQNGDCCMCWMYTLVHRSTTPPV